MLQDPLQKERGRRKRGCREGERKREERTANVIK